MTSSRLYNRRLRAGVVAVFGLAAALFNPLGAGFGAHFASAAPLSSIPTVSVTVPAGGSAALAVQGFALEPGAAMPQGALSLAQQPLPSDRVRTALFYGVSWGYAQSNPQQVALAIWWIQNGAWLSDNHAIADGITSAALSAPGLPSYNVEGRPITTLAAQGQLIVGDLSLTPRVLTPATGTGNLVLRNTTAQDIVVHLPYGTQFTGASGSAIVWATGPGQIPTGSTPTLAPPTQISTSTPQPSPTTPSKHDPNYTPSAETTATPEPPSKQAPLTPTEDAPSPMPAVISTQVPAATPSEVQPAPVATTVQDGPAKSAPSGSPVQVKGGSGQVNVSPKPDTVSVPVQPQNVKPAAKPDQAPQEQAPASRPASSASANSQAGPPLPASTVASGQDVGASAPPPPPVSTSLPGVAQVTPPKPDLTTLPTLPVGGPTATPTTPTKQEPTTEVKPTEPPKIAPTDVPKANPTPVPTELPVAPPGPSIVPTISTGTDPLDPNKQIIQPLSGGGSLGAPPTSNTNIPTTGGGPSSIPAWLALCSAIMMLGGWTLRRTSNVKPEPIPVEERTDSNE